ncbi:MAG: hypothetical protein J7578_00095 [Chitinophagaceae bacterium]|nr:hypothetical protein [Chitinophagaceae bacterium]
MKTIKIIAGLLLTCAGYQANAQMEAAQKITLDKDTTVYFDVSRETVWKLVKVPANWAEFSKGYINSITVNGDINANMKRTIQFADGSSRVDEISQFTPEYRFIVNRVVSPVPKGVTENFYGFSMEVDPGKGSTMKYMIKVDGDSEGKKVLLATLENEMRIFIAGLKEALSKLEK